MPRWRRVLTSVLLLPPVLFCLVCASFAYKIYAHNGAATHYPLQAASLPSQSASILIVSPHPDDEVLGAGGLIRGSLARGCTVHVVFMTNGDAFRVGVSRYYRVLNVTGPESLRYGTMRQGEATAALKTLGLPASDITFLGYPDRSLMGMWEHHWVPTSPWTSSYTRTSTVAYSNAPSYKQPDCGQNVLDDLVRQIEADHATEIYVTHPNDDHPDHAASAAYVNLAIARVRADGAPWATQIRLHYFLIHRGDWPVPQGLNPTDTLAPPAPFLTLDTQWRTMPLSPDTTAVKESALDKYGSQEEMMGRFLLSFIRRNEVFGQIAGNDEQVRPVNGSSVNLSGGDAGWPLDTPVALDPAGDTVVRDFQASGDIIAMHALHDDSHLYLRMDLRAPLSTEVHYTFSLRAFDRQLQTSPSTASFSFTPAKNDEGDVVNMSRGVTASWHKNSVEFSVPLADLSVANPDLLFLAATTSFAQVVVDKTGYRALHFADSPPGLPLA